MVAMAQTCEFVICGLNVSFDAVSSRLVASAPDPQRTFGPIDWTCSYCRALLSLKDDMNRRDKRPSPRRRPKLGALGSTGIIRSSGEQHLHETRVHSRC